MNNSIFLVGRVGQTPVLHTFTSGKKLAKFSLAVKELSSEDQEKTLWIDVEAWNGISERVLSAITVGREVVLQGRLAVNSYINDAGAQVTRPVVRLASFHLCGRKAASEQAAAPAPGTECRESA